MKKIALTTLGCKVNQYESASFTTGFTEAGCEVVPFSSIADIYVINTCSVTARAAQQSRQLIRRAMRTNPDARIVVTGCYSQMASDAVMDIIESKVCLIGNGYKHLLVETALQEESPDLVMLIGKITSQQNICNLPVKSFSERTRAYLRVQDGCNNFCSYCIVPYTRGPSRSLAHDKVMKQADDYVANGFKEMVITGINVGKYGADLPEAHTIYSLIDQLCMRYPKTRIRLSSIEPTEVNDELLELYTRHNNLLPHFHIPLQSGDDQILRKMYRQYTVESFAAIIMQIHKAFPHAAIGCDVLCGFPGETETNATNTYQFLDGLPVSYLHVFPYSKRPGTLAASYREQVPKNEKDFRVKRLRQLDESLRLRFYERNVGTSRVVLVERIHKQNKLLQGFTDNYIPLLFAGGKALVHQCTPVHIDRVDSGKVYGTIVKPDG